MRPSLFKSNSYETKSATINIILHARSIQPTIMAAPPPYFEGLGSGEVIELHKHIEECHNVLNEAGTVDQHVHHQLTNSTRHSTTCTVQVM